MRPEPAGYAEQLKQLKERVRASRVRTARAANSGLLGWYWSVGRDILDRQEQAGWGSRVIDRLAVDLREEFPDQRGWSRRNLHYMRALAQAWPEDFVQQTAARLPWGHVLVLLDKVSTRQERDWYALAAGARVVPVRADAPGREPAGLAGLFRAVELRRRAAGTGLEAGAAAGA